MSVGLCYASSMLADPGDISVTGRFPYVCKDRGEGGLIIGAYNLTEIQKEQGYNLKFMASFF